MNKKILFGLFVLFFMFISFKSINAVTIICDVDKYVYDFNDDGILGCYNGPKCKDNFQSDCQCSIDDYCNSSKNENCSMSNEDNKCIILEDNLDCKQINENYYNKTQAESEFNGDEDLTINFKKVQNTPNNLECYKKKQTCEEAGGILIKNITEICPDNLFSPLDYTLKVQNRDCVKKDATVVCDYENYCEIKGQSYFIYNIGNVSSIRVKSTETGVNDERLNCSEQFNDYNICNKIYCLTNSVNKTYYDPNNVGKRVVAYFFNRDDFKTGYNKAQNVCGSFNYSKCVDTLDDYSIDNTLDDQKLIYCRNGWSERNSYWKDKFSAQYFCKGVDSYLSKLRNEEKTWVKTGEQWAENVGKVTQAFSSFGYDSEVLAGYDVISGGSIGKWLKTNDANTGYNKFINSWNGFLDSISSPIKNLLYSWCANTWGNPYTSSDENELMKANMRLSENAIIDFSAMKWKYNESNSEYFYYFQWALGSFPTNITYFFCLSDDNKDYFTFNDCKDNGLRVGHVVNNSEEGEKLEKLTLITGNQISSLDINTTDALILANKDYEYVYFCLESFSLPDFLGIDFNSNDLLDKCYKKEPLEYIDYVIPNLGEINKTMLNWNLKDEGIALAIE